MSDRNGSNIWVFRFIALIIVGLISILVGAFVGLWNVLFRSKSE